MSRICRALKADGSRCTKAGVRYGRVGAIVCVQHSTNGAPHGVVPEDDKQSRRDCDVGQCHLLEWKNGFCRDHQPGADKGGAWTAAEG